MYYLAITLPPEMVRQMTQLEKYTSFLTTMCLAMGAVFQLPIAMIFASRLGLIEPATLLESTARTSSSSRSSSPRC